MRALHRCALMALDIFLCVIGAALAWLALRDVFETVVVPAGNRASLQVTRLVGGAALALYKLLGRRKRGISSTFAPFVLVSSFLTWMSLLAIAFGLINYAFRASFDPPITTYGDAVYEAGSALLTIGLSTHYPVGIGRWLMLAGGFCGLAVMTMAVTYLLEVQSGISRRDIGVIKLNTAAGDPPSALTLLERFAAIRNTAALPRELDEARNWCATVRQSHSAHPSLIYFRSLAAGAGWPAALAAWLDLALIAEHLIADDTLYGPAVLLREEGSRAASEMLRMTRIAVQDTAPDEAAIAQLAQRLESSGYKLREFNCQMLARQRAELMSCVDSLAAHLGGPSATLVRQS